jgi:DNA-binding CsgD family transcriptional regulator
MGLKAVFECAGMRVRAVCSELPDTVPGDVDVLFIELEALRPLGPDAIRYISDATKLRTVVIITREPWYMSHEIYVTDGQPGFTDKNSVKEASVKVPDVPAVDERVGGEFHSVTEPGDRDSFPPLSTRENQVLLQLSYGLTHHQIARQLQISRHTVDTYVRRIRAKLGVGNKAELTRMSLLRQVQ